MSKRKKSNIVLKVELTQIKPEKQEEYQPYKFKDLGYLLLLSNNEHDYKTKPYSWVGFITPQKLKNILGDKQYSEFSQGKRIFIIH